MFKFTIEYYYSKYHSGDIDCNKTRVGIVYAKSKDVAILKVRLTDNSFIEIKNMTFEEVKEGAE